MELLNGTEHDHWARAEILADYFRSPSHQTETMADQQELMDIFDQMDRDGDRILTKAEISSFLLSRNFNKKFIEEFLATFDSDSDGRVTEAEYGRSWA
ncbi:hypothetical protein BOX15_Mlig010277g2 [Macrostomum lignano]|uniref:EF-hand domain-containing protein n=1 Tax=Macrostomum lignano TaxID=282301 RepID=A0A267DUQ4_9PLAT|nr:hypothetical protein BOX15_Mlig010277g2 [Macrostomum lignano]